MKDETDMKDEYDFSNAERGKFYRKGAILVPPVHLETDVLTYFERRAQIEGKTLNELVSEVLRKDMELVEATR